MQVRRIGTRIARSHAASALVVAVLALSVALTAPPVSYFLLAAFAVTAIGWIAWLNLTLQIVIRRVAGSQSDLEHTPSEAVEVVLNKMEDQLDALRHRTREAHPVSGLPLREALIAEIGGAQSGYLGIVALKDVDRLCAFDPELADRFVGQCAARLKSMVLANRFLAHIDRGHFGIWFGERVSEAEALAELQAVAYALESEVHEGGTRIEPQIATRLSQHDTRDGVAPPAFIAQTLAFLSLPAQDPGAVTSPAADESSQARARFTLEQDLRQAIDRHELHLLYQPLIDAGQRRINGAEALIRWEHPDRGTIAPSSFIPMLEEIGLADEIGAWALNTAVREAQHWEASGLTDIRVAVNVSALQLQGDGLPRFVARALHHHGGSANCLEIELTESIATSDLAHCRDVFAQLRAMGVKLAVDDFGTGYSGFSSLRRLAFDKIKIDREFVAGVHSRTDCQAICQSIIALGRGLGIRVLAEGVEHYEEYAWLHAHGCQHFQGFYFARPLPADAFIDLARNPAQLDALLTPHVQLERFSA